MLFLIAAAILYTIAITLGAFAARNGNTNLVGGITNLIGAVLPLSVAAVEFSRKPFAHQRLGIIAAIGGGVAIAFFVMVLNKSFTLNKVGIVTPVVFGGSIFLSAIIGYFVFKERTTVFQLVGLALVLVGIICIGYAKATGK